VARSVLLAGAVTFAVAGIIALGISVYGVAELSSWLPQLSIDDAALGGAILALGLGFFAVAAVHAAVVLGLRARKRVAWTIGVLLTIGMGATLVTLAAASATSAAAVPDRALAFLGATIGAALAAAAYAVAAIDLVGELRSGSAT
jgi:hypothetical protein